MGRHWKLELLFYQVNVLWLITFWWVITSIILQLSKSSTKTLSRTTSWWLSDLAKELTPISINQSYAKTETQKSELIPLYDLTFHSLSATKISFVKLSKSYKASKELEMSSLQNAKQTRPIHVQLTLISITNSKMQIMKWMLPRSSQISIAKFKITSTTQGFINPTQQKHWNESFQKPWKSAIEIRRQQRNHILDLKLAMKSLFRKIIPSLSIEYYTQWPDHELAEVRIESIQKWRKEWMRTNRIHCCFKARFWRTNLNLLRERKWSQNHNLSALQLVRTQIKCSSAVKLQKLEMILRARISRKDRNLMRSQSKLLW